MQLDEGFTATIVYATVSAVTGTTRTEAFHSDLKVPMSLFKKAKKKKKKPDDFFWFSVNNTGIFLIGNMTETCYLLVRTMGTFQLTLLKKHLPISNIRSCQKKILEKEKNSTALRIIRNLIRNR